MSEFSTFSPTSSRDNSDLDQSELGEAKSEFDDFINIPHDFLQNDLEMVSHNE